MWPGNGFLGPITVPSPSFSRPVTRCVPKTKEYLGHAARERVFRADNGAISFILVGERVLVGGRVSVGDGASLAA